MSDEEGRKFRFLSKSTFFERLYTRGQTSERFGSNSSVTSLAAPPIIGTKFAEQ